MSGTEELRARARAAITTGSFHDNPWLFLLGGTLLAFGSDELCEQYLPPLLDGTLGTGCLLYSEPGAGSDLAGLQTRADRDGDHYVVTGQKIWTTGGHEASFGLLIARTDWDVPKHPGLSFFVIDMHSAGIDVRPIRQITGESDFNEVFLNKVRVPVSARVGDEGQGWKALQVALAAERSGMGSLAEAGSGGKQKDAGPGLAAPVADLIERARSAGRAGDPAIRQELMKILSWKLTNAWTGQRALAEIRQGSSSLASLGKLANSRVLHSSADLAFRLQGEESLAYDYDHPTDYPVDRELMWSFINSIGGGSDQIQRNIISERVLGLPKGYEPDKGVPFSRVRKGADTRSGN
ncbi:MAG: acyl-CoA dehydrogenase family protein [Streptosporangiales bacterium]|nr:acyl-CoA dehydrogenase family protein [Streptosporangiales bacterium]